MKYGTRRSCAGCYRPFSMRRMTLMAVLLAAPLAANAKRPGIAVMDVRSVQGVQKGTATLITDIIITEVSGTKRFDVVGSSDITNLLGLEKQKQLLQCSEGSSCLTELGGALGVDYLISGTVGLLGSRLRISLTVQNAKRARVVARQARFCDANEDALVRATEESVRALLADLDATIAAAPPPVVPKVEPRPEPRAEPKVEPRAEPTVAPKVEPAKPSVTLAPAPPKRETKPDLTPPPPEEPKGPSKPLLTRRGWAYAVGGAGLALVAAGGAFDYLAYSAYQDQKSAVTSADKAAYDSALSSGKTRATVANVLYGTGLATLGAGAYLYFTSPAEPQISVTPTDGGAILSLAGVLP